MTTLIQFTQNLLFHNASLLAQVEYSTEGKPPSPLSMIVGLLIALLLIVAMWKVFTKAGKPGWASIIPIYNLYIWCKIVGRPGWWIIRPRSFGHHFLSDPWFRQRAVSRAFGFAGGSRCSAAAACLDRLGADSV